MYNFEHEIFKGTILHTNFAGHILQCLILPNQYNQTNNIMDHPFLLELAAIWLFFTKKMTNPYYLHASIRPVWFSLKKSPEFAPSFACSSAFFSSSESALSPPHSWGQQVGNPPTSLTRSSRAVLNEWSQNGIQKKRGYTEIISYILHMLYS